MKKLLGGCAVLFVLGIVSCAGLVYWGYQTATGAAGPLVDELVAAMNDGTFADTYESATTAGFREATSLEEYAAIGEAVRANLGPLESKSLESFSSNVDSDGATIEATYGANFAQAEGTIDIGLVAEGVGWLVTSLSIKSPALTAPPQPAADGDAAPEPDTDTDTDTAPLDADDAEPETEAAADEAPDVTTEETAVGSP